MQVDTGVGEWQQLGSDEMRNRLCRRAHFDAGKAAIHIALVERRDARIVEHCGVVQCRQQDQAALDIVRGEVVDQPAQYDLALVFVAVIARARQQCRSAAVADADDRHRDFRKGVTVVRKAQLEIAELFAVEFEIERAFDPVDGQNGASGLQ